MERKKLIEDANLSDIAEDIFKKNQVRFDKLDPFLLVKIPTSTSEKENRNKIAKRAQLDAGGMLTKAVFGTAIALDSEVFNQKIQNATEFNDMQLTHKSLMTLKK